MQGLRKRIVVDTQELFITYAMFTMLGYFVQGFIFVWGRSVELLMVTLFHMLI